MDSLDLDELKELAEDFQNSKGVKTYARMPYTIQLTY